MIGHSLQVLEITRFFEKQSAPMAVTTVTVEPEHYIPVPRQRLVDVLVQEFGDRGKPMGDLSRLLEALLHFEFRELVGELKRDYLRFDPGRAIDLETMLGGELSEQKLDEVERRFLKNFVETLGRANFIPLTQQDIDVAEAEDYLFSLPVEVDWSRFDSRLTEFLFEDGTYVDGTSDPPEFARRALLFRRGVGVDRTQGFLFFQKLDMFVSRILVATLRLVGRLLRRPTDDIESAEQIEQELGRDSDSIFEARTIQRVTMRPEDGGPLSFFRKTLLQEPTFSQLVLVFRLLPDKKANPDQSIDRTIHIKTLVDIPMADLEVVFPEKRLSMKPVDLIKVIATVVEKATPTTIECNFYATSRQIFSSRRGSPGGLGDDRLSQRAVTRRCSSTT